MARHGLVRIGPPSYQSGGLRTACIFCVCRYWRFLVRRFLRIWPMLAVLVAIHYGLGPALSSKPPPPGCTNEWWQILLFINNFSMGRCHIGQTW